MIRFIVVAGFLWVVVFLSGCSTLFKGDGTPIYRDLIVDAGEAPEHDVFVKTERILNRYIYETVRQEESSQLIYFETRWQYRPPFDDEKAQGITEARTRLTIQARPRRAATTAGGSNLYRVQIMAENMVQPEGNDEWVRMPNSDMYKAYIRKIAEDLKNEFRMSIRKF